MKCGPLKSIIGRLVWQLVIYFHCVKARVISTCRFYLNKLFRTSLSPSWYESDNDSKKDRARAISYFRRAIQMKPDFISAWTLIGHEYIEMRNFAEAISSYHKGISLDPSDSRAWFGLGQAFFFLKMYSFSVQNYLKVSSPS